MAAGAMGGNNKIGVEFFQFLCGPADNRLKGRAGQVKASHDGMDLSHPRYLHGPGDRIDDTGMGTTGKDNQGFAFEIHYYRGIIFDGVPLFYAVFLEMSHGKTLFEFRSTGNFP